MIGTITRSVMGGPTVQASNKQGCVPQDLVAALREHGMPSPLRGLRDPRVDYPELLLTGGWERYDTVDGYAYRYVADTDPARNRSWEQIYQVHDDGSVTLVTRAGNREHTVEADEDGNVSTLERTFQAS